MTEDRLAPKLPCPACGVPHPYGDACPTMVKSDQEWQTRPLEFYEAPNIKILRIVCEAIGYGRVIQLAETWMEELTPGWLKARDEVIRETPVP